MNTCSSNAVSVVVVTYHRRNHLRLCLEALACQSLPFDLFEVIVVDDGGLDESGKEVQDVARRHPTLNVQYHWHEHDGWGLARSRNEGAALCSGKCIEFIDSDILLNPDALASCFRLFRDNPDRVIGGYYKYLIGMKISLKDVHEWKNIWNMTLPEIMIPQHEYQLLGTDVREAHFNMGLLSENLFVDEAALYEGPFSILGGNILVPFHVWKQTEGFDELITHYGGEDAEFSIQVADLGYRFSYAMSIAGCHMAHTKQAYAQDGTNRALVHIRRRWPLWFTKFGEPIWSLEGWTRPPQGRRTSDADME